MPARRGAMLLVALAVVAFTSAGVAPAAERAADGVGNAGVGSAADIGNATGVGNSEAETDPPLPNLPPSRVPTDEVLPDAVRPATPVRVALVDSGVNYTLPVIARALARGPDGVPLGRDFWDMDDRPFDRHPLGAGRIVRHGTRTASVLIAEAPRARLVPYRYPRPDMRRMRDLVEHAAANAVRVVGLPLGGNLREEWAAFEEAAMAHPHILFVASAGNDGRDIDARPVWPASLALDNLVVVTSADDFGALAERVNRGRVSVDYLVPAENVPVLRFDGTHGTSSGSSYAVPRVVALAARLLERQPDWQAAELVAELRRRFADGTRPREVAGGIIPDPLAVGEAPARVVAERSPTLSGSGVGDETPNETPNETPRASPVEPSDELLDVPLDVLVPNAAWNASRVDDTLTRAAGILAACRLRLAPVRVLSVAAPERLSDLSTSGAHTLFEAVRASGPERRVTVVLARDTRMHDPYDGEAFGRGNTRLRPWLADSVWLTAPIRDAGIALAHELVHVLANSGAHDTRAGNLMLARTTGDNTALAVEQCEAVRAAALASGSAVPASPAARR